MIKEFERGDHVPLMTWANNKQMLMFCDNYIGFTSPKFVVPQLFMPINYWFGDRYTIWRGDATIFMHFNVDFRLAVVGDEKGGFDVAFWGDERKVTEILSRKSDNLLNILDRPFKCKI